MMEILSEDECNDTYGRERMHKALLLKYNIVEGLLRARVGKGE